MRQNQASIVFNIDSILFLVKKKNTFFDSRERRSRLSKSDFMASRLNNYFESEIIIRMQNITDPIRNTCPCSGKHEHYVMGNQVFTQEKNMSNVFSGP